MGQTAQLGPLGHIAHHAGAVHSRHTTQHTTPPRALLVEARHPLVGPLQFQPLRSTRHQHRRSVTRNSQWNCTNLDYCGVGLPLRPLGQVTILNPNPNHPNPNTNPNPTLTLTTHDQESLSSSVVHPESSQHVKGTYSGHTSPCR